MIFDFNAFADLIAQKVAVLLSRSLGDEALTVDQAAALLHFHPNTVRQMATRGEIPGRKFGAEWRFRRSALLDCITDNARLGERQPLALASD